MWFRLRLLFKKKEGRDTIFSATFKMSSFGRINFPVLFVNCLQIFIVFSFIVYQLKKEEL